METTKTRKRKPLVDKRLEQVGIRVETWLKHALDELARKDERSMTQVARQALKEYVERRKNKGVAA
jgi:predicted transcriptional regulator